jgi:hypothetical protein
MPLPPCEMPGQQDDLPHVNPIVGNLTVYRLHYRVGFPADGYLTRKVVVRREVILVPAGSAILTQTRPRRSETKSASPFTNLIWTSPTPSRPYGTQAAKGGSHGAA